MVAEAGNRKSHCILSQEADSNACLLFLLFNSAQEFISWRVSLIFRKSIFFYLNSPNLYPPYKDAQKFISMVIVNLIK